MVETTVIEIAKRLRRISHALDKHSKSLQERFKVTIPQLICLWEINRYGPITLGNLTDKISLNKSTVTGIVDRLERQEYVCRTRVSKDRRQIHVEITQKGKNFLKIAPAPLQDSFVNRLESLGKTERDTLLQNIDSVVSMIGQEAETMN